MTRYTAKLSYLRIAPRKVRALGDLVKGLSVNEAEAQLMLQRRRVAGSLLKLLRSAVANAKSQKNADVKLLFVESLRVDQGPMLKRYLPRARGMATPIQKKMSHVTLVLSENANLPAARFQITIKKKAKLPPEGHPRAKAKDKDSTRESGVRQPKKSSGFFKKVFSRKTAAGT